MSDVITVRIPRRTKENLKKHNINISETVRKALEACLDEVERKDLEEKLEHAKKLSSKIDRELFAKLIREDREFH